MTVQDKIWQECTSAFHNRTSICCAKIYISYHSKVYTITRDKHIPSHLDVVLKVGHSLTDFNQWLKELDIPYINPDENSDEYPFIQRVSGTIWFNDGSWLTGFISCYTWKDEWSYHSEPEIPEELL